MIVTRLNPSVSGAIHIGHCYCALVNERLAHQSDGKFYVRFDDTSQGVTIVMSDKEQKRIPNIIDNMKADIEWMGITVDDWSYQSDFVSSHAEDFAKLRKELVDPYPPKMPISIRMGFDWIPYPYTPYQTAERVLMDKHLGITHLIRGDDFFLEYSHYYSFCDTFGVPMPEYILLPRLTNCRGESISKTNGGYTIAEMRSNGYSSYEVLKLIEDACLIWPPNGWSLHNLKREPRLNI